MKTGLWALLVAVCGLAMIVGGHFYQQSVAESQNPNEQALNQIKTAALRKNPDAPVAEAMRLEGNSIIKQVVDNEKDSAKRTRFLTESFFGFYMVNTRSRFSFCQEQGVDIHAYVDAFAKVNAAEYAKAQELAKQIAFDPEAMVQSIAPQLNKTIAQDMTDIAAGASLSIKAACTLFVTNANQFAEAMYIGKRQPEMAKALFADKL
jgi:hypothetical protein